MAHTTVQELAAELWASHVQPQTLGGVYPERALQLTESEFLGLVEFLAEEDPEGDPVIFETSAGWVVDSLDRLDSAVEVFEKELLEELDARF